MVRNTCARARPEPPDVTVPDYASAPRRVFPLALAEPRLHGGGSTKGVINSITKVHVARCLARPWGRNEDRGSGTVPWAGGHGEHGWARLLRSALLRTSFASLVLQEQLLRDPTCPHLARSSSLPALWASQGRGRREGAQKGASYFPPPSPLLAEASSHPGDRDGS